MNRKLGVKDVLKGEWGLGNGETFGATFLPTCETKNSPGILTKVYSIWKGLFGFLNAAVLELVKTTKNI